MSPYGRHSARKQGRNITRQTVGNITPNTGAMFRVASKLVPMLPLQVTNWGPIHFAIIFRALLFASFWLSGSNHGFIPTVGVAWNQAIPIKARLILVVTSNLKWFAGDCLWTCRSRDRPYPPKRGKEIPGDWSGVEGRGVDVLLERNPLWVGVGG